MSDRHPSRIHPARLRAIVARIARAAAGAQGGSCPGQVAPSSARPEVSPLRGHPQLCPCAVELPGETS
jgi:hypothetical protein